jgi:hypothetical protein
MTYPGMKIGAALAAFGLALASPAWAAPRDRTPEIHVTVRAKRIVIPPPLIEQVGAGETRIQFPATRGTRALAFTMARVDGRYIVSSVETLD